MQLKGLRYCPPMTSRFETRRLADVLGVEVLGADLRIDLDESRSE